MFSPILPFHKIQEKLLKSCWKYFYKIIHVFSILKYRNLLQNYYKDKFNLDFHPYLFNQTRLYLLFLDTSLKISGMNKHKSLLAINIIVKHAQLKHLLCTQLQVQQPQIIASTTIQNDQIGNLDTS
jgi:hypothetical protein